MMKSIQTKIVVFILVIIMLCSGVVGSIAMIHLTKVSEQNSAQIMNLSCRDEGKKLDSIFYSVEQSVKIISSNTVNDVDMIQALQSETMREMILANLRPIILAAANSTKVCKYHLSHSFRLQRLYHIHIINCVAGNNFN